jgi:outer membrane protein TolC
MKRTVGTMNRALQTSVRTVDLTERALPATVRAVETTKRTLPATVRTVRKDCRAVEEADRTVQTRTRTLESTCRALQAMKRAVALGFGSVRFVGCSARRSYREAQKLAVAVRKLPARPQKLARWEAFLRRALP